MKEFFNKILSIVMAFVVLFSTTSFTIDMHYCGDTLVDIAFFSDAESCAMEQQKSTSTDCSIIEKNCCSDEQIVIEGQDELKMSKDVISFDQQLFVAAFIYSYVNLFEGLEKNVIPFDDYPPPFIVRNIQQLDEVYLI